MAADGHEDLEAPEVRDAAIDALIADRLRTCPDQAVIVLPMKLDGAIGRYRPGDVYAVKDLRRLGLDAGYLHDPSDRTFLHEHSSQEVWSFAIGVGSSLTATAVIALWQYIRSKVAAADDPPADPEPPIRIEIRNFRGNGVRVRRVVVEGPANEHTRQMLTEALGGTTDE